MRKMSKKDQMINMLARNMALRCIMEGCRYGIEGIDQDPTDVCIWCGTPRREKEQQFHGVNIPDLIKSKKEVEDGNNESK